MGSEKETRKRSKVSTYFRSEPKRAPDRETMYVMDKYQTRKERESLLCANKARNEYS